MLTKYNNFELIINSFDNYKTMKNSSTYSDYSLPLVQCIIVSTRAQVSKATRRPALIVYSASDHSLQD